MENTITLNVINITIVTVMVIKLLVNVQKELFLSKIFRIATGSGTLIVRINRLKQQRLDLNEKRLYFFLKFNYQPVSTTTPDPSLTTSSTTTEDPLETPNGLIVCYFTNWAQYRNGLGRQVPRKCSLSFILLLTDTSEDSKVVDRRICAKVSTRISTASERRV